MISFDTNCKITSYEKKSFNKICDLISKKITKDKSYYFTFSFVLINKIKQLNYMYRKIDKPTDVISFAFFDSKDSIRTNCLGEIYICKSFVNNNKEEINLLFTHGILHLLGYDHHDKKHENIMFKIQEEIINKL
jgi:probable rRNA maturation factor